MGDNEYSLRDMCVCMWEFEKRWADDNLLKD